MRRFIIFIITLFCILPVYLRGQFGNAAIIDYYSYLNNLPFDQISSISTAKDKYVELFKNENPAVCDTAFVIFDEFRMTIMDQTEFDIHLLMNLKNPENADVLKNAQQYWEFLQKNGFSFAESDDIIVIIPYLQYITDNFYPYLSKSMQQFLNKTQQEEKQGFSANDSLSLPLQTLINRIIWWDNFIVRNPNFVYLSDAKRIFDEYLQVFIFGLPNSPLFTEKRGKIKKEYTDAYKDFVETYPKLKSADIIQRYLAALKLCKNKQCLAVQTFTW